LSTTAFAINPQLSAIAIAYQNPESALIADMVLPRVPTAKKFKYTKYTTEQGYTVPTTLVGRKSEPHMVDFGGVDVTDECLDYGLDDLVPVDEVDAYNSMPKPASGGPINPVDLSTMMLTGLVQLDREIRVASTVFASAAYSAPNQATLAGTSQWSDQVNSNPLSAILNALDIPLVRPNKMVIGQQAWTMPAWPKWRRCWSWIRSWSGAAFTTSPKKARHPATCAPGASTARCCTSTVWPPS
jgi:hypothetical protein